MIPVILFLLSIGLQFTAAIYALLLIRITGRKLAWVLISIAMLLMASRRIVSFVSILISGKKFSYEIPELIALIIACLMLLGVLLIRDYFRSINLADSMRKKAEEALLDSEEKIRSIVSSAFDAIIMLDNDAKVSFWNDAASRIFGFSSEEALGKDMHRLFVPLRYHASFEKGLADFKASGEGPYIGNIYKTEALKKDGTEIPVEISISALKLKGKWNVVGIMRDVTAHKKAEEKIAERERQAALGSEVGAILIQSKNMRSLLQSCTEAIVKHLDAAFARIWTLNETNNILELQASAGMYTHINGPHGRVPVGKFKIGLIAEERKPHLTNAVIGDPRISDPEWAMREEMVAFAGYPLLIGDKLVGVMAMFSKKPLDDTTLTSLSSIANEIALGIERKLDEETLQEKVEELEKFYKMSIGRELKMNELKEEITRLKEELSEYKKGMR